MSVDGYRFLDPISRRVMRAWQARDGVPDAIPWAPLDVPLSAARVALVSSAGLAHRDDEPFDQEGERRNPWWGDPTVRTLARTVAAADVRMYHLHVDPRPAALDLECLFPLRRLDELVDGGVVGSSAPHHYSIMGYQLDTGDLVRESAPRIAVGLVADEVDLALFVPV